MIVREIAIYQKEGDKYIKSFEIDLSAEKLINILNVDTDKDPNVYMVYAINKAQFLQLQKLIPNLKEINFENVELFYECFQTK
ncbi:DUF7683 domain-containing protein [Flavobacterium stagni]|uniref:DUF7683 domain-containing protein n=1 Tax=Flavobacterium stagni TaxID=2506421 RepID=A0A4Q1K715_9FLAO|nr:hypothetical protein [Flavobacterium stagni]RXR21479.1 hypothetical protein EQG61_12200 [Flavobacterium stagni]